MNVSGGILGVIYPEFGRLDEWVAHQLGVSYLDLSIMPLAGDASFREYFRVTTTAGKHIAVYAPPKTEDNLSFIKIQKLLKKHGIRVPEVEAKNINLGYFLLEDLGDSLLFDWLPKEEYFNQVLRIMLEFSGIDTHEFNLPEYSSEKLESELGLFSEWFLIGLLGLELGKNEQLMIEKLFQVLVNNAIEQPQVFTHRDFHSRNIMCLAKGECAVIDFQDAVVGPITYDFVSLMKDCYFYRPPSAVDTQTIRFRDNLIRHNLLPETVNESTILRWVDLMGLQRHLKVLGIFARLYLRDNKSSYLVHLPLVLDYVTEVISKRSYENPVIYDFRDWFETIAHPVISLQKWMSPN